VVGTRLLRRWQGRDYEVVAIIGGYEFEGRELPVAQRHRQENHRRPLERAAVFRPEKRRRQDCKEGLRKAA